jgi:hypothetical protein
VPDPLVERMVSRDQLQAELKTSGWELRGAPLESGWVDVEFRPLHSAPGTPCLKTAGHDVAMARANVRKTNEAKKERAQSVAVRVGPKVV